MILEGEAQGAIIQTCPASTSGAAQGSNVPGHLHSIDQRHDYMSRRLPWRVGKLVSNRLSAGRLHNCR